MESADGRLSQLVESTHQRLLAGGAEATFPDRDEVLELVRDAAPLLGPERQQATVSAVMARVHGLGPLDPLICDPEVTDVLVNGPGIVWVERAGSLQPSGVRLTRGEIDLIIERIVAPTGRRADRSSPVADAVLPDGSRAHIVLPPLAVDGPALAIRTFSVRAFPLEAYADPPMVAELRRLVTDRANILISGGTGTGKTSLLNALAALIPSHERVVSIEDAAELRLPTPNLVRLEAQPPGGEGAGAVTLGDLVRSALRLRPDRLVIGEVRGPEAADLLQALNTGHSGSMSSCHANDPLGALRRLETLALLVDGAGPLAAIREQVAAAIDIVVHVARVGRRDRRIVAVGRVGPVDSSGRISIEPLVVDRP